MGMHKDGGLAGLECMGWKPLALLGDGGQARVYAVDNGRGESMACKISNRADWLYRESLALKAAKGSKLPAWRGYAQRGGWAYLWMELLEGESLESRVLSRGLPEKRRIWQWMAWTAEALADLYQRNGCQAHGDLKGRHILLQKGGGIRLLDGGSIGLNAGTAGYMPPELWLDGREKQSLEKEGIKADIYALGVLGYYWLTGVEGGRTVEWLPPGRRDRALESLLEQLLQPNPAHRPGDMAWLAGVCRSKGRVEVQAEGWHRRVLIWPGGGV